MIWFYLVSLVLTADGRPAADIPIPFATLAECNVAGLQRAAEVAASDNLTHGVWACLGVDFEKADPRPAPLPAEPILPKREG